MDKYNLVADLIIDVITSKLTLQEALKKFPNDNSDINLKCAFDALIHYEADEDLRKKIPDYALVQDEYLANIAQALKQKHNIPSNIVARYYEYHKDNIIAGNKKGFRGFIDYIKRMINF